MSALEIIGVGIMSDKRSKPIEEGSVLADRYELIKTLGEGGMGCVFMARHKQVGRAYAVKVLWTSKADDERMYRRFLQEAKIAGSFSHANLAAVYDYGETEDGYPFLVMDLVDGVSLQDLLTRTDEPLELQRSVRIFLQICAGLKYAHEKGLVHRDLKPANIMVVGSDGQEEVKIVDFGITKVLEAFGEVNMDLTKAGEIFGSPFYLSPEQCLGHPVDARSDIYSLGCLMYRTLSGRKPVEGHTTVETIVKHIHEPPPSFSEACPERNIPAELERIVRKCLEKEPEQRYQSLTEVSADLTAFLDSGNGARKQAPAGSSAVPANQTAAPTARSISFASPGSLIAIGVVLVLGIGLAIFLSSKTDQEPVAVEATAPPQQAAIPARPAVTAPNAGPKAAETAPPIASVAPVQKEPQAKTGSNTPNEPETKEVPGGKQSTSGTPRASAPSETNRQLPATQPHGTPIAAVGPGLTPPANVPGTVTGPSKQAKKEQSEEAKKLIAHLQFEVLPKLIQEIDKMSGTSLHWDVDWASFHNSPAALRALEQEGLNEIREALQEYALEHTPQALKTAVKTVKIVNVGKIYERQVVLRSGVLTIHGAWAEGSTGTPASLDIKLAIAGGADAS